MSVIDALIAYFKEFFLRDNTQFIFFSIFVAAIGGIANWVMGEKHSFLNFISAFFLAGFAGFLVGQACLAVNIEGSWAFFICGSSGLAGEAILRISRRWMIGRMGKFIDQDVQDEINNLDKEHEAKKQAIIKKGLDKLDRNENSSE